jgi:hypothetical protein
MVFGFRAWTTDYTDYTDFFPIRAIREIRGQFPWGISPAHFRPLRRTGHSFRPVSGVPGGFPRAKSTNKKAGERWQGVSPARRRARCSRVL